MGKLKKDFSSPKVWFPPSQKYYPPCLSPPYITSTIINNPRQKLSKINHNQICPNKINKGNSNFSRQNDLHWLEKFIFNPAGENFLTQLTKVCIYKSICILYLHSIKVGLSILLDFHLLFKTDVGSIVREIIHESYLLKQRATCNVKTQQTFFKLW